MQEIVLDNRKYNLSVNRDHKVLYSAFSSYKPDPAWNYQDMAGHIHRWDLSAKEVHSLKKVIDRIIPHCCDGDCWEDEISHLECRECGEVIDPGYLIDVPAWTPIMVPTRHSISGDFELLPGEAHIVESDTVTFSHAGKRYQAYITGYDVLLPVSDPIRQTGITVHFGEGKVIA